MHPHLNQQASRVRFYINPMPQFELQVLAILARLLSALCTGHHLPTGDILLVVQQGKPYLDASSFKNLSCLHREGLPL